MTQPSKTPGAATPSVERLGSPENRPDETPSGLRIASLIDEARRARAMQSACRTHDWPMALLAFQAQERTAISSAKWAGATSKQLARLAVPFGLEQGLVDEIESRRVAQEGMTASRLALRDLLDAIAEGVEIARLAAAAESFEPATVTTQLVEVCHSLRVAKTRAILAFDAEGVGRLRAEIDVRREAAGA